MSSPNVRAFDGGKSSIRVEKLECGNFLVKIYSGVVRMAITVPPEQVAFLFDLELQEERAA